MDQSGGLLAITHCYTSSTDDDAAGHAHSSRPTASGRADAEDGGDHTTPMDDYARFISHVSSNRRYGFEPAIMNCMDEAPSDSVFLASGLPNIDTFPIVDVAFHLHDGTRIALGPELTAASMQYGVTRGYRPLLGMIEEWIQRTHGLDASRMNRYAVMIVPGAQDALSKTVEAILDQGDGVVAEQHPCPRILATLAVVNPSYTSVETDTLGRLKPESLRQALLRADYSDERRTITNADSCRKQLRRAGTEQGMPEIRPVKAKPKILLVPEPKAPETPTYSYSQPVSPAEGVTSARCRRTNDELYDICRQHDLLLLERELISLTAQHPRHQGHKLPGSRASYPAAGSFLSIDVDCRVVHVGDFSDLVGPGTRLGYVVGPRPIIERVAIHQQTRI